MSTVTAIHKLLSIFKASEGTIRPHAIVTGSSGAGKSHNIKLLADQLEIPMIQINAAGLTKEGISGNSLSKALTPLLQLGGQPAICFVDEFDKLFISGNSNSMLAHESTNGVQNEFLTVLEGTANVFGDWGKFHETSTQNVLFLFAGAFNGEQDLTIDRLKELGVKTEFLGRVGLVFNIPNITLEAMLQILKDSTLVADYLQVFKDVNRDGVIQTISDEIKARYVSNTLGARLVNTLVHQYFITGSVKPAQKVKRTLTPKLQMDKP